MRIRKGTKRVKIFSWNTPLMSIIILLVISAFTISISAASDSIIITMYPENQTIYTGDTINISVNCSAQQPIKAYEFDLSFNSKLLKVTSVSEGNFFDGYLTFFNPGTINNDAGLIENIYCLILGPGNVTNTGTLIFVNFTATSSFGTTTLVLMNINVTNEEAVSLPVQVTMAGITVNRPSSPPENQPPSTPMKPQGLAHIEVGVPYLYNSSTIDPDGDRVRLRFDWGDDTMSNWTGLINPNTQVSLNHTWLTVSNYTIRVIAQDENGINSSWSDPVIVIVSQRTSANFDIPLDVFANQSVIFNASGSYAHDSVIVSYQWNFGDGLNGTGKTPVHIYNSSGQYNVTLTITNEFGMTYTKTKLIAVSAMVVPNEKNELLPFSLSILALIVIFGMLLSVLVIFRDRIEMFLTQRSIDSSRRKLAQFDGESTTVEEILDSILLGTENKTTVPNAYNILNAYRSLNNNPIEKKDGFRLPDQRCEKIERLVDDRLHAMIVEKIDKM